MFHNLSTNRVDIKTNLHAFILYPLPPMRAQYYTVIAISVCTFLRGHRLTARIVCFTVLKRRYLYQRRVATPVDRCMASGWLTVFDLHHILKNGSRSFDVIGGDPLLLSRRVLFNCSCRGDTVSQCLFRT